MTEYYWVLPPDGKTTVPIGARVLSRAGNRINVKDDDLNEYTVSPKDLRPMHPSSVLGVEDMTHLGDLQEYSILRNLQIRYRKDLIYTYVGSILIAVNPYKMLPIYGKNHMIVYRKKKLGELPPHIFAVADHSYESMRKMSEKRCIVVSGESGAGKTESTKLFLQYFATISPKRSNKERQILDSNPILEAFGNAKTIRNDNSSRFGKYISIYFSADGSIHSAEIKHYLLEKSRIVSQNKGEENYHIFYALLNGLAEEQKRRLQLTDPSAYTYLSRVNNAETKKINPHHNLELIVSAMKVLNFSDTEIWRVFELLAAILHFGNIDFVATSVSNVETVNSVNEEIRVVCSLLQVSEEHLKTSLTKKTISTHGDNVVKLLSKQEAINSRDAFVKKIFGNLFNYIVEKINENLFEGGRRNTQFNIGILDIFGFETFEQNSFEQLCINFANERLQQFFISHVFKIEQETYATEGIAWKFVEYPDNQEILDLIEAGPKSILSTINDCTKIPRGTDENLLDKLMEYHSKNPNFLKPKFKNTPVFGIQHFAGVVLYDTKDIIEKNYDSYSMDFKQVVQESENNFLKKIFANDFESENNNYYKKRLETLASKFQKSLDSLMSELNESQPFFVRCIKPNEMKKPQKFDRMLCCKQLTHSGMIEVTKVREAGYPVRYDFLDFVQHYRVLVPGMPLAHQVDCKAATRKICQTAFRKFSNPEFQLGRTKIFLKHSEELFLEAEKEKALYLFAVTIQKLVRGWLVRRRQLRLKKAVLMAENCWLQKQQRAQSYHIRHGLYRLQARIKSRLLLLQFRMYKRIVTQLQAHCRGYLLRKSIQKKLQETASRRKSTVKTDESISFKEFARKHFQSTQTYKYSKKPIKTSLTSLVCPEDVAAAKAIWITILRFTKNISEPPKSSLKVAVSAQLREILQTVSEMNEDKLGPAQSELIIPNAEKVAQLYENWLKRQTTELEKLHFIVGHGIKRPELRDEIYCQICKALTKNPSKKKTHRGWELLMCCVGCFPPSDLFLQCLKTFIRKGYKKYTSFCLFRLHRVMQNGCRTQPPHETELLAIRRQKPVQLEIHLANGAKTFGKVDSATTVKELLDSVAKNLKLIDVLGFCFVLRQETKQLLMNDGSCFVLDAVSECEQYAAEMEEETGSTTWKLHLKKDMFAPWFDPLSDEVSTNLVYHQIKDGIITGDYGPHDSELPSIVAHVCYAEEGNVQPPALGDVIQRYVPLNTSTYVSEKFKTFEKEVENRYQKMIERKEISASEARDAIVKHAAVNWTLQFSRFFNVVGSMKNFKTMEFYPEVPLLIGVNSAGIIIIDESSDIRMIAQLSYIKIHEIKRKELAESGGYMLKITSYDDVEVSLVFPSASDSDFFQLINKILETLKKYSRFAMAVKEYQTQDKSFLELSEGDLITLSDNLRGEDLLRAGWAAGTNNSNGKTGHFLLEYVEIIKTVERPDKFTIKAMRKTLFEEKKILTDQLIERLKYYTLESYAKKNFYFHEKSGGKLQEIWKYSKQPIVHPLLAKIANNNIMMSEAVALFEAILKYQDHVQDKIEVTEQLLERIFNPGLKYNELKNETYCQILKQLTSNTDKRSENRMWELLWLMTGLFGCEATLASEVKKFLHSRRALTIARECLNRFNEVQSTEPRKSAPHLIELEAVKKRPCHIFHRVYFPDDTNKFFKIHSLTKFKDLKEAIHTRLNLHSSEEFSIFIQILERLFLAPEDHYVFDCLQNFKNWIEAKKIHDCQYKICFMKTEWNPSPTCDKVIDLKFIFPQEYNKYIHGFYEILKDDIVELAALLYKMNQSEPNDKTQNFQLTLQKLIPSKATKLMKVQLWQEKIEAIYKKNYLLSSESECKISFLKYLSNFTAHSLPYFTVLPEKSGVKNYMLYSITHRPTNATSAFSQV